MTVGLVVETSLGEVTLIAEKGTLTGVFLPGSGAPPHDGRVRGTVEARVLKTAAVEVEEYLDGRRRHFTVPLRLEGTDFQRAVWEVLQDIPFGETRSYAEVASALGRPGAARAIGQANRRNPVPLIVPCHRVVAADGSLGGYMGRADAGEGLKARLLEHEARIGP